jgi:hypothetical protein
MLTLLRECRYEPQSFLLGSEYFLHAYGPIYALSADVVASLVALRNNRWVAVIPTPFCHCYCETRSQLQLHGIPLAHVHNRTENMVVSSFSAFYYVVLILTDALSFILLRICTSLYNRDTIPHDFQQIALFDMTSTYNILHYLMSSGSLETYPGGENSLCWIIFWHLIYVDSCMVKDCSTSLCHSKLTLLFYIWNNMRSRFFLSIFYFIEQVLLKQ